MSSQNKFEILATAFFAIALLHTFMASNISKLSQKFRDGSVLENFFHLFGEVEIVFGFWSAVLVFFGIIFINFDFINNYLSSRNFTEPMFVFVIMAICATKPIIKFSEIILIKIGQSIPCNPLIGIYFCLLFLSPLLGSFITEPAAMTISAFLLLPRYFTNEHSLKFKYATLALLFVNISIGGTLTPFAAPPVLMVAKKWNWDLAFMLQNFASRTILASFLNTLFIVSIFKNEIKKGKIKINNSKNFSLPNWIVLTHFAFLFLVVVNAHYPILFVGIFLFFIGFLKATKEYQSTLILREPLLVAFFLSGIIVLGGPQQWWLEPIITSLSNFKLYCGSIGLTAFTDNAALTYLGSLVSTLDADSKLALVKGSVVGGGLTLMANAPNLAGFGILRNSFGEDSFSSLNLVLWALPITFLTSIVFYI